MEVMNPMNMQRIDADLSLCRRLLNERETYPADWEYFFCNPDMNDDEGLSYCLDCIKKLRPNGVSGIDYRYLYPEGESDGCCHCDECGKMLRYTLTDYGVNEELAIFEENNWDWNDPSDCYRLARMAWGAYSEDQKRRAVKILRAGMNRPAELQLKVLVR